MTPLARLNNNDVRHLSNILLLILVVWTLLCLLSGYFYVSNEKKRTLQLAEKEAITVFNKDKAFRQWGASHGGVYVPVTKDTQPNPALSHLPERDILTDQGTHLTLLNPAYMMRQIMEMYEELYDTRGHITSLKLINEDNAPDEWEAAALKRFEAGEEEVFEVVQANGHTWMRLIRPMIAEMSCLKCHAQQGYQVGDVRGAVGVSVDMQPYYNMESKALAVIFTSHILFWLLGVGVIGSSFYRGRRRIAYRHAAQHALEDSFEKIKIFAYSVSHDLKNPVVAIHGLTKLLEKKYGSVLDERGNSYCQQIMLSAEQISKLVEQINVYISTKEQPIEVESLDPKDIFAQIRLEHSQALAERAIKWHEPESLPAILADRIALLRVFRNFVDNALKYGGEELANIEISYEDDPFYHIFAVHNDGVCLSEDACRKVFELFARESTSRNVTGSGLGLAIVKEIAEQHEGRVWSESKGDSGVTFYFAISKELISS